MSAAAAPVAEMRYFAGLTDEEIAASLWLHTTRNLCREWDMRERGCVTDDLGGHRSPTDNAGEKPIGGETMDEAKWEQVRGLFERLTSSPNPDTYWRRS